MKIQDRAMLIDLSIKAWTFTKMDVKATNAVAATHGNDVDMARVNKHLVSKNAVKELTRVKGAARTEHYKRTLPWNDNGQRLLSSAGYFDYSQVMREFQSQWDSAVAEFVSEYPNFINDARIRLNGLFRESDYPSVDRIRDKFAFGFNVIQIPDARDFRVDLGAAETARVRAEIEASVNATIEAAMRDVWERMRDVVSHMVERLRAYSVDSTGVSNPFRDSLVENVRDLVRLIPSLNITGNSDITAFAARIESDLLNYNADTLRASQYAREETVINAEDILRQMSDFI
jgi:hypothetical protein